MTQILGQFVDFDLLEQRLDRLSAHPGDFVRELAGELLSQLPVSLIGQHLTFLERQAERFDLVLVGDDDVVLEIEYLLELAQWNIEQMPDAAGQPFEEPDVRTWARQFYMAETLAPDFRLRHFNAALVADYASMLHPLVFAAQTLPVRHRSENARAKQPVPFGFERPIIDRLGLHHVAV